MRSSQKLLGGSAASSGELRETPWRLPEPSSAVWRIEMGPSKSGARARGRGGGGRARSEGAARAARAGDSGRRGRQEEAPSRLEGEKATTLTKAVLNSFQRMREVEAILFLVLLMLATHVIAQVEEKGAQAAYAKAVRQIGKGHSLGPPSLQAPHALMAALVGDLTSRIGAKNLQALQNFSNRLEGNQGEELEEKLEMDKVLEMLNCNVAASSRGAYLSINPSYRARF